MHVKRHIPAFVDREPEPDDELDVETVEQLLAVPYIHSWTTAGAGLPGQPSFRQWEQSRFENAAAGAEIALLMATLTNGAYYVVAYVDGDLSSLPEWTPPARQRIRPEPPIVAR